MKKAFLIIGLIILSMSIESIAAGQTRERTSVSNSKTHAALEILNDFNKELPCQVIDNLYFISFMVYQREAEIFMRLENGTSFVPTSIDFGVYNFIGYICHAVGMTETEAQKDGFKINVFLYDKRGNVLYTKEMNSYDCLAFYNRQKSTPSLEPNLESFRKYAEGLDKETPLQVGEGIVLTSVTMSGNKMIYNHTMTSYYAQLFKLSGIKAKEGMERWNQELIHSFYEILKDVLDFMEKEKIEFRYRVYEEGTNNMIHEMIITPQEIRRSHQAH